MADFEPMPDMHRHVALDHWKQVSVERKASYVDADPMAKDVDVRALPMDLPRLRTCYGRFVVILGLDEEGVESDADLDAETILGRLEFG